jgi:hypothetical protein
MFTCCLVSHEVKTTDDFIYSTSTSFLSLKEIGNFMESR